MCVPAPPVWEGESLICAISEIFVLPPLLGIKMSGCCGLFLGTSDPWRKSPKVSGKTSWKSDVARDVQGHEGHLDMKKGSGKP